MAYVRMDESDDSLPNSREHLNGSEPDRFERISLPDGNGAISPPPEQIPSSPGRTNLTDQTLTSITEDPVLRSPPERVTVVRRRHLQKAIARKFSGAEGILVVIALILFCANAAARGYLNGILHLIQHTMNIKDSEVIFTDIMFDIGIVIGIIPGVMIRGSMHRPKTLAISTATLAVGCFMCSGPYFWYAKNPHRFSEPEDIEVGEYELCMDAVVEGPSSDRPPAETAYSSEFFVIFGAGVMGIGASLMFVVGLPYTVDAFGGRKTPLVTGILLIATAAGVWSGELFSFLIQLTVADDYSYSTVSKWWLGFLLFGLFTLLFSLYLCTLPDTPPDEEKEQGPDTPPQDGEEEERPALGELDDSDSFYYMRMDDDSQRSKRCLPFLAKHVNIVFLSLALSLEGAILTGYLVFQPQFMSAVIDEPLPRAELSFASVTLIPLIVGVLVSAFYIQFVRMDSKQLCRMILIFSGLSLLLAVGLFLFSCTEPKIFSDSGANSTVTLSSCSESCGCTEDLLAPVCGANGKTYLSPCLAGCHNDTLHNDTLHNDQLTFHHCTCISDQERTQQADAGPCSADCSSQGWHMLLIFIIFFLTGLQLCAAIFVILKASEGYQRVCALAFCEVVYRIIGNLPALGYFRFTLTHTCLYWASKSGRHESFQYQYDECIIFDVNAHHRLFAALVITLKVFILFFYAAAFIRTKIEERESTVADRESIHFTRIELDDEDSTENEPPETPV